MPSQNDGGDPRNNAEDAYLTFMSMPESEWNGLNASLFRGGMLQPAEHQGWLRASTERWAAKKLQEQGPQPVDQTKGENDA